MPKREDREHRFDRARGAKGVAGCALRRGDRRAVGLLLAERELQHAGLARVAGRRRRAVRVHVADVVRRRCRRRRRPSAMRAPGSRRSGRDRRRGSRRTRCRSRPARRRCGRRAPARAPAPRARRTAAPSAITNPSRPAVERARRSRRVVVSHRQRAHRAEAREPDRCDRRLGAAAEHHVGAAEPDRIQAVADRHVRRCAGGALREQRAARAELDRDPPGGEVRQASARSRTGSPAPARGCSICRTHSSNELDAADRGRDRRAGSLGHAPDRRDPSPTRPDAPPPARDACTDPSAVPTCGRRTRRPRDPSPHRRTVSGSRSRRTG